MSDFSASSSFLLFAFFCNKLEGKKSTEKPVINFKKLDYNWIRSHLFFSFLGGCGCYQGFFIGNVTSLICESKTGLLKILKVVEIIDEMHNLVKNV